MRTKMFTVNHDQQNDCTIIETDDATIKIQRRAWKSHRTTREMWKNTRIHVWGVEKIADIAASEKALPPAKMQGEDRENDRVYAKHNRMYASAYRNIAESTIKNLIDEELLHVPGGDFLRMSFSRYAGCSCPCSPGVIVNRRLRDTGDFGVDVYITMK